ncbi:MAG: TRAP transporter large permease [Succinivibrio sp.]|nr:TRAP transporter large permease [Succinivibrio sp.]
MDPTIATSVFVLFATFIVLLFLSVPISICIVVSSLVTALGAMDWSQITFLTMQKMNSGIESFSLLAVPLFILAGNIMNNGGIANRLIDFAKIFVGKIPGSLAQTNVLGNMFFGALAGSAVAASAAIGGTLAPIEKKEGYDMGFATAVNIASAPTGLLIPPTSAFIVYSAVVGGVSISALFMAGYIPGILMGLGTMLVAYIYAKRHKYPVSESIPLNEALTITLKALPSLLLIIIVIGGIVGGIFTATEGAGVCVAYCLILSICYKSLTFRSFMRILLDSACVSGIILFLISSSSAMSYVMAFSGIPGAISQYIMSLSDNPYVILLLINLILLAVGTFMDITPAILIFTPIFLPIAQSLGMTPVQFGVVLIFNMCMGSMTPPVGSVLFVSCSVSGISIEKVIKPLIPYVLVLLGILMLVTYIPWLSIGIPTMMGLM